MTVCRSVLCCLCGRRSSLLRKLLVLIVSLSVIFWVSLLGHQQRQSLVSNERQEPVAVNFNNKGKNTPRVLMDANNAVAVNQLVSQDQVTRNLTSVLVSEGKVAKASPPAPLVHSFQSVEPGATKSINSSAQEGVAISKQASPRGAVHLDAVPSQKGPDSLQLLHQQLRSLNRKQKVLNANKFPPLSNDGLVLIVQVHKRENYLKQLFESLKKARGIEKVLLVISHDYYYDDMNAMVESVDFCRVS